MNQILHVDACKSYHDSVLPALRSITHGITAAGTLQHAKKILDSSIVNLVLLDLNLPESNGIDLLATIKTTESMKNIPVIILSDRTDIECKIHAFSLGADDFLSKTIDPFELRVRIEAHIKRSQSQGHHGRTLNSGPITLDIGNMKAFLREGSKMRTLDLTAKEYKIISFLMQNNDLTFTRTQLIQSVWTNTTVSDRTVDTHVCSLRRKLAHSAHCIESVPGIGYRFNTAADNQRSVG